MGFAASIQTLFSQNHLDQDRLNVAYAVENAQIGGAVAAWVRIRPVRRKDVGMAQVGRAVAAWV